MKLQIQHRTTYRYSAPASYSIQLRATTPPGNITTTNVNYITVTPP